MDRITEAIPRPRTVTLAGRAFPVWEARLCDLAELQGWLDDRQADPLDGLMRSLPDAADGAARDRALFAAADAATGGGPTYDSPEGRVAFDSPEGRAFFIAVALRRGSPGFDPAELVAAGGVTPAEFTRLRRVFFGADDAAVIGSILGVPPPPTSGRTVPWAEAVDDLAGSRGWTYEYIGSLTLTEFVNARRRGRHDEPGFRGPPEALEALEARAVACGYRGGSPEGTVPA